MFLQAFLKRAQQLRPGRLPEAIMVDNSKAEIAVAQ